MKDLCVCEVYNNKKKWNKIGVMFEKGDKQYIKLFHIPGVLISVFEQKKKEDVSNTDANWQPTE